MLGHQDEVLEEFLVESASLARDYEGPELLVGGDLDPPVRVSEELDQHRSQLLLALLLLGDLRHLDEDVHARLSHAPDVLLLLPGKWERG